MGGHRVPAFDVDGSLFTVIDDGTLGPSAGHPPGIVTSALANWSAADKLGAAIKRAARKTPGEAGAKLLALVDPSSLRMMAAMVAGWVAAHAIGVGEAVDLLMVVSGFIFVGWEAISAVKHLSQFVRIALSATTYDDLDRAGWHLATAIAIIGVDAALALLARGAARTWKSRYRPKMEERPWAPAGTGETDWNGDIWYSTAGTLEEQALVRFHEQVHSALSPKIRPLFEARMKLKAESYWRSELLRYLEEALAEGYAQLRVNGVKGLPAALRLPFNPHYRITVKGLAVEIVVAGTLIGGLTVAGMKLEAYLEELDAP